jgi:hypothetical protein
LTFENAVELVQVSERPLQTDQAAEDSKLGCRAAGAEVERVSQPAAELVPAAGVRRVPRHED